MKDALLITYSEPGEEIHFMLVDYKHKKHIDEAIKLAFEIVYYGDHDTLIDLENFINDNLLDDKFIQSYDSLQWFSEYNIVEAMGIPYFGC